MSPAVFVSAVAGLGLAGLDPAGALMIIPALLLGARRRLLWLFTAMMAAGTVGAGLHLGESLQLLLDWLGTVSLPSWVRMTVQLLVAVALACGAVRILAPRRSEETSRRPALTGPVALGVGGLLAGASSVLDPSFVAMAAVESQVRSLPVSVGLFTGWLLVSQSPLMLLVLAVSAGRDTRLVRSMISLAQRMSTPAARLLGVLLGLIAVLLAFNALTWLLTGSYWPV